MNPNQIHLLITTNLTTITTLILTNKTTIFFTTISILILHRMLKTLHHRRQFPIFTATKPVFCSVCLDDIHKGQRYRRLPQCHHCFHVTCVDTWLQLRTTCPLCRNEIPVHLLPRKEEKKPGFLYLFVYFSIKAVRTKIRSKMMMVDAADL